MSQVSVPGGPPDADEALLDAEESIQHADGVTGLRRPGLTKAEQAKREYDRMDSVTDARAKLVAKLVETCPRDAEQLTALTDHAMTLYEYTKQYHNADHVMKMTKDIVELAEAAGIDPVVYKRMVITGLYHDADNKKAPGKPGEDELGAARKFIEDFNRANDPSLPDNPSLGALKGMEKKEAVQIVANILGTVFPDRFMSADDLQRLDQVKLAGFPHPDYVADAVKMLREQIQTDITKEDLATAMVGTEALMIKNADIKASLETDNLLKNFFANFSEDLQRGFNAPFVGKTAREYRNGFYLFLDSSIHGFTISAPGDQRQRDRAKNDGAYFLTPADMDEQTVAAIEEKGKKLKAESEEAFAKALSQDGQMLNLMQAYMTHTVVSAREAKTDVPNIPGMRLGDLREKLKDFMNGGQQAYEKGFDIAGRQANEAAGKAPPGTLDRGRNAVNELLALDASAIDTYLSDDRLEQILGPGGSAKCIAEIPARQINRIFGKNSFGGGN